MALIAFRPWMFLLVVIAPSKWHPTAQLNMTTMLYIVPVFPGVQILILTLPCYYSLPIISNCVL